MENGMNGSASLQAKINEPTVAAALTRLLDRIDSLEQTVNTLADMVQQGPGMVAMLGDMADESMRQANAQGINVEERLKIGLALAEKITNPETAVKINNLLALADEAPSFAAMVGDMIDDTINSAKANGIDLEARLSSGLAIANRLTDPQMVSNLEQLLDMADQAPMFVAMMGDMVDDTIATAKANGINIEERAQVGLALAEKLTAPEMTQALSTLVDPKVVSLLNKTGNAVSKSIDQAPPKIGLIGLLGALRDEDTQKALGFLTTLGKNLGKEL